MSASEEAVLPMHVNALDRATSSRALAPMPPFGTFDTPNGLINGLWAMPRPRTRAWGHGEELMERMAKLWGPFDVGFGERDNMRGFGVTVDIDPRNQPTVVANWAALPFADESFRQGYWDPPYLGYIGEGGDVHYDRMDPCMREMVRVISYRFVILSPLVYPCPKGWTRDAVIAVTYGPNKVIRALQGFIRNGQQQMGGLFG